jgi:hypothetical protein
MRLDPLKKAWFPLPGDAEGAEFEIKHLRSGEISKITDLSHTQTFNLDKENKLVPCVKIDTGLERRLTITAAITDWKNVFDAEGKPVQCNAKNKKRLLHELSETDFNALCKFVQDSRKTLAAEIQNQKEIDRGN